MSDISPGNLPELASFGSELNVAVLGTTGGIGGALADRLEANAAVTRTFRLARSMQDDGGDNRLAFDLEDEASIRRAAETLKMRAGELDLVIVATGLLHDDGSLQPEKSWRSLSADSLERAYRINAVGPALVAKHFLPLLATGRKSAFAALSARVGSIADNGLGGWYAYRASKAALNMLIRTLSIELARRNPDALCVGLHPGTVDTGLSRPFQRGVPDGRLFSPDMAAGHLLAVLDGLGASSSGGVYAWDGAPVPA